MPAGDEPSGEAFVQNELSALGQYVPTQGYEIDSALLQLDGDRLNIIERGSVPCANPISCNSRSVSKEVQTTIGNLGSSRVLFDGLRAESHPLGFKSFQARSGSAYYTGFHDNEVRRVWELKPVGVETSASALKPTGRLLPGGSTIAISDDGSVIFYGTSGYSAGDAADTTLRVEGPGFHTRFVPPMPVSSSFHGAFVSPSGKLCAIGHYNRFFHAFECHTGRLIASLSAVDFNNGRNDEFNAVAFQGEDLVVGAHFAYPALTTTVRLLRLKGAAYTQVATFDLTATLSVGESWSDNERVTSMAVSPQGKTIVYRTNQNRIGAFDVAGNRPLWALKAGSTEHTGSPNPVASFQFVDEERVLMSSPRLLQVLRLR